MPGGRADADCPVQQPQRPRPPGRARRPARRPRRPRRARARPRRPCWRAAVMIHTSAARRIVGRVSEIRVGGGFGQLRTATTERVSYTAGDSGKIDATWPSSPMPSMTRSRPSTAVDDVGVGGRGGIDIVAELAVRRRPSRAPAPGRPGPGPAARPWPAPALRSGSAAGTNRSSPQKISTRDQSTASRAGESLRCVRTLMPTPPPVSATTGTRPVDWMSTSLVTSRAAVVAASRSALAWMTTSGTAGHDARRRALRRRLGGPPRRRRRRSAAARSRPCAGRAVRVAACGGSSRAAVRRRACPARAP